MSTLALQRYFSGMASSKLSYESRDKIRDVLSSILGSSVQFGFLVKNPIEGIKLPPDKKGRRKSKPFIDPASFNRLIELIPEPYASIGFRRGIHGTSGQRVNRPVPIRRGHVSSPHHRVHPTGLGMATQMIALRERW